MQPGCNSHTTTVCSPEVRLEITTPPTDDLSLAITPDGQKVVFAGTSEGQTRLWLRGAERCLSADAARHPRLGTADAILVAQRPIDSVLR